MAVRHVVVWRLVGESDEEKNDAFASVADDLHALVGIIPGLTSLSVSRSTGPNPKNWDMCLISEHDSWDALAVYDTHPDHVAVASRVIHVTTERSSADFEL